MELKRYGLTNPQKNIYLIENYYKGTPINNVCGTCIFHSVLNFELLKQAINMLIQNNDCFKLHFDLKHGEVYQYVEPYVSYNVDVVDVNDMSDVDNIEIEFQKKVYNVFSSENAFDFKIFSINNIFTIRIINIFININIANNIFSNFVKFKLQNIFPFFINCINKFFHIFFIKMK